jgi:type IV secretory pathway TraG/TraD family ATPase VirD4
MIVQDIREGSGVCFIDPHGSDVMDILANVPKERYEDVIYFDPSSVERPMALNMLEFDRRFPEQKTFVVNEMFSIFQKLYGAVPESMGPMFEQYFRNATMLVIEDPDSGSTLLDVSRVMSNKAFRDMKIANCKNPIVVQFWREIAEKAGGEASLANIVPYITSKFDVFLSNEIMRPIIAQEKSSFNLREVMDSKKILLVNLSKGRLGDINSHLIGLILVGKILMSALSRVDSFGEDMPPFYLYLDEFQNITTDSISTILSEARKYKLALTVAHQFIGQLDDKIKNAVFGNVGSMAVFRVGTEDSEFFEKQFNPVFSANDIANLDNFNAYLRLLSGGRPVKPFNVRIMPPEKGNKEQVSKLKELSFLKFGRERGEVEAEVMEKYKAIKA